jgi:hypothetical protein
MVIVSDTSPVTSLIQIGRLELLNQVFGNVVIPKAVYQELCKVPNQQPVIDSQNWLFVQKAADRNLVKKLEKELDEGEAEAIALALELKADYLVIDEFRGRDKAEDIGLKIIGTIGTLLEAKKKGLIPKVKPLMDDLIRNATFRIHPTLYQQVLKISGE